MSIRIFFAAANSALAAVNGQLSATPASTSIPGTLVGGGDGRLAQIQGQIADGQARGWTDAHPDMVVLRGQLTRARAPPSGGPRMSAGGSSANPMYITLRSMQAEKQATASALAARKTQIEGEINRILSLQASNPEFTAEQTAIDRDYEVLKAQYDKLLTAREEVRLRGQAQTETAAVRISVIDPPTAPRVPEAPNRPLLLSVVLLLAIGGGIGAAFAHGQLKTTYSTATRLERASGLPVIGSITEVVRADERALRRKRRVQFAGGAVALVGMGTADGRRVRPAEYGRMSEALMSKDNRRDSLIERAAEIYDFGAVLRGRQGSAPALAERSRGPSPSEVEGASAFDLMRVATMFAQARGR